MSLQTTSKALSIQTRRCNTNYKLKSISCKIAMPQAHKSNLYEVLCLESSCTENVGFEDIKKAYRKMALQYHPDVCPPSMKEESTKRFLEVQKAYETLSNPISRQNYDYELGLGDDYVKRVHFSDEVLEKQLHGLKQWSAIRMQRKTNG